MASARCRSWNSISCITPRAPRSKRAERECNCVISLDMAGCSITVSMLDGEFWARETLPSRPPPWDADRSPPGDVAALWIAPLSRVPRGLKPRAPAAGIRRGPSAGHRQPDASFSALSRIFHPARQGGARIPKSLVWPSRGRARKVGPARRLRVGAPGRDDKDDEGRRHGAARAGNGSDRSRRLSANAGAFPRGRRRAADVRPIAGPHDHPRGRRPAPRRRRSRRAPSAEPLPRPLVQRRGAPRPRSDARGDRTSLRADRRPGAHRARARRAVSDDPRPQGAGRLRLPRAPGRHRPVRPNAPSRDLALDRKLLPRRRRHLPHPRLPRRRGAAGKHEPGAVRLARALGRRAFRHHPHAGLGEQRQGDLRRLRRARPRSGQHRLQPVLRIRQLPRPPPVHRRGARAHLSRRRRGTPPRAARRLRFGDRIGGNDRRGRSPESGRSGRASRRSRRSNARPCS